MTNTNSTSEVSQLTTSSAEPSQPSSNNSIIYRTANNRYINIGFLYNAIIDFIHGQLLIGIEPESRLLREIKCSVEKGETTESENLRKMILIDGEQRLSLMLNIAPAEGISSFLISPIPIDKYTRFIYYRYLHENKYIPNDTNKVRTNIPDNIPQTNITHVVSAVNFGIHLLIILQIHPHNQIYLDDLFKRISEQLMNDRFEITPTEKDSLDEIISTKVFSNMPNLARMTKLTDVCERLIKMKQSNSNYLPIDCILRSIEWFYPSYCTEKDKYFPLDKKNIDKIEEYLLKIHRFIKHSMIKIDSHVTTLLEKHFNQQFEKIQDTIKEINQFYSLQIESIRRLVLNVRTGKYQQKTIDDTILNEQTKILINNIENLTDYLNELINKTQLIKDLNEKDINYFNIGQLNIQNDDDLNIIIRKIIKNQEEYLVFSSNDQLRKQDSAKWDDIYQKMINQSQNNRQLQTVYADFSYCSFSLTEIKLLSSNHIEENSTNTQRSTTSSDEDMISSSINYINVLLLGESGVGKSTFINAFVNYLTFQNFDEAHSNKAIVLIPVSFSMTIGENFEEYIVKSGNEDLNEDHHHPGQSVTQKCKSYLFNINNNTKLRLIDTPGMGSTHGCDQDDINIDHIISYINNLEHLNSICILIKPNQSRLNTIFRSYFDPLLKFLGSNARHNIIFCFTNTRSTCFNPGDTGPSLKSMIESYQIKDIPFQKCNTFCFDSESFRYLIALQNQIQFDDYQKQEFKQSWIKSVPESIRMFKYISKTLKSYPYHQWRSMEHAKSQITQLIRPLLETIRNIYQNIILREQRSTKLMINLRPEICSQFSAICSQCNYFPKACGDFWIIPDDLHTFQNKCDQCQHSSENHIMIDYKLEYELLNDQHIQSIGEMNTILDQIDNALQGFIDFFIQVLCDSNQTDPILSTLDRMISDENFICKQTKSNDLNSIVHGKLIYLRNKHEEMRRKSLLDRKDIDLNHIYTLIKDVCEIELVNKQMDIIKQVHQKYIEENQIQILHKFSLNLN